MSINQETPLDPNVGKDFYQITGTHPSDNVAGTGIDVTPKSEESPAA